MRKHWFGVLAAALAACGFSPWRVAPASAARAAEREAKRPAEREPEVDADLALPQGVVSNQNPADVPLPPAEAVRKITLPDGFRVTLFAGEPHVRQPIGFALDHRGRLWVAEAYAYRKWQETGQDRLLIFEDTDGDGQFDRRKVFARDFNYISGVALGFGGVFVCSAPRLLFLPDADGDDVPDGPPQPLLEGWGTTGVHNVVNGLTWGPDGWLYGLNGITAPSKVGLAGAPEEDRQPMNCGVWRYHPTRRAFEIVAHGTTNPWGLDYDDHGQFFFTNCVIDHLFHLVPGAHYKRMFGSDLNPYVYELMDSCVDYRHWAGGDWTKARGGEAHHEFGGGHAHAGAMIYLGDNWPDKYRHTLFTCNIHGNRVNNDGLERAGSAYKGLRRPDFMFANDPWFRGLELKCGPDGGVYVSDWTDLGECHDNDGVHRDSGRIHKVVYGKPTFSGPVNVAAQTDAELVALQLHKNDWWVRTARRVLQERAAAGKLGDDVPAALRDMFEQQPDISRKLRALWALHAIGAATPEFLTEQLGHASEHARWWAIQLLAEPKKLPPAAQAKFVALAASDASGLVRLALASALQRLPLDDRWAILEGLLAREADAADRNLSLMLWYATEPLVAADPTRAAKLLAGCKLPLVRQSIARRITGQK